jgi:FkbM family methyltransferase
MDERSVHIEKCLDYYLLRHFSPARRLKTATIGDCPYSELLRGHSSFAGQLKSSHPAIALFKKPACDLVYLGGGHDFLDLAEAIKQARNSLVGGGILVLPHLDVPTTRFCYDYLKASDEFILHFTMEETAFLSLMARTNNPDGTWTASGFNRQNYPAYDHASYTVLPTLPLQRRYDGFSARCGEEFERGFTTSAGRMLSEGLWSRIGFNIAAAPGTEVEVTVELRACVPQLPRPVEISLSIAGGVSNTASVTDGSTVPLSTTGKLDAQGVLKLELKLSEAFVSAQLGEPAANLPNHALLAVELVSLTVREVGQAGLPRTIRHHDGRVASVVHAGQEFRFFVDDPHDSIQAHHVIGEFYELEELELLKRHVGEGARILDVGANIGNHIVYFERVMKASRVVPIELQERVISVLRLNAALNGLVRTDLSRLGIGFGASDHGARIVVPQAFNVAGAQFQADATGSYAIRRGDDVLAGEDFDLIKIDVEGMECDVIDGLDATIRRSRPKMFVEVWQKNLPRFEEQMARLSYRRLDEWRRYDVAINLLMEPDDGK